MISLGEKNINHACMRLNSEQALTPMERDPGIIGDSSQKSPGQCAAGAKTASFCSYIKVIMLMCLSIVGVSVSAPQERSSGGKEEEKGT